MKLLSELNLLDRFLFACTMENVQTMELVLQIILGRPVKLYDMSQAEKEMRTVPWLKSIRLDVITMDEYGLYNTEVQKKNTGNLLKRSRFYQAVMDSPTLAPGEMDFNKMPDVTRIFLNTHGTNDGEVSEELVSLLHYFEDTTEETISRGCSERIREIHKQISRIKSSEKSGVKYMQAWEEKAYAKLEGREEGRKEIKLLQVAKKLAKGKSAEQIAEELEDEVPVIEKLIKELQDGAAEDKQNQEMKSI